MLMCENRPMADSAEAALEELRSAVRAQRRAQPGRRAAARARVREAIAECGRWGVPQPDVVETAKVSREHVRVIWRNAGIPPKS